MGIYVEEIGGWVEKYIFKPTVTICFYIVVGAAIVGIVAIPIAAVKYLLEG